ncbi:MAG: amidohydrolase [Oscillospiraceae bacterium]|nr:amidohydrolase [Oscillospiraceae bacterium]
MDILFSGASVVTMDGKNTILKNAFVLVRGERIAYVGSTRPVDFSGEEKDCSGKVLMPGFVNAHTHLPMTLMRGFAGGHDLQTWLNDYIFPVEAKLDGRAVKAGTQLALAEAIACGITSVSDMYYFCDDIIDAVNESGISANIARGLTVFTPDFDPDTCQGAIEMRALAEKYGGADGDAQIKADACIHGEYTSYPAVWEWVAKLAADRHLITHVHLSETKSEQEACIARHGMTPAAIFEKCGVWDSPAIAAHCVWTTPDDWKIMKKHGVTAVHNPASNMKLASGAAPVRKMLDAGINVALGTDGMSSNDNHDMFEEMKLAALLAKVTALDPTALSDFEVLRMAAANGAKAQGRHAGVIEAGAMADVILVDFAAPNLVPCHDIEANLVAAAHGGNVCMNMARGKIIYENGGYFTLDMERILSEVNNYALPKLFG